MKNIFVAKRHIFAPEMYRTWFKYLMAVSLLMIYINRGLFVATPGVEISCAHPDSSNEINSLLEVIINWAGGHNYVDEDGDSPESYSVAKTVQPLIDQSVTDACMTVPYAPVRKIFYLMDEAMTSLDTYGTIDHPPEIAS